MTTNERRDEIRREVERRNDEAKRALGEDREKTPPATGRPVEEVARRPTPGGMDPSGGEK